MMLHILHVHVNNKFLINSSYHKENLMVDVAEVTGLFITDVSKYVLFQRQL